ncbi:MAG: FAD-dependent oxidoreductase [Actinomycetota bacterium]|nr:FAD-dependent oxidoreductase [Actinomycetota bacterium]
MKDRYQVVVIGGGIVGASVLYHLTLRGLTDVALVERAELTAGSSWHAAGGFHAINADTHIAALQKYTIGMYPTVEQESGQSVGLHMTGGLELAGTPERWEWLKTELAWLRTMDTEAYLVSPDEAAAMCPIIDPAGLQGALFDPHEGNLDPHGATHAYAGAARRRGAEVVLHNRVLSVERLAGGDWRLETELGPVTTEHVVNAAGLWARKVGRMVGVDHPLVPMQHHYLVTEDVPEVAAIDGVMPSVTDLEGFTYLQREKNGVLLGVYEQNPRHWQVDGPGWDYGMELIPKEIERISPELSIGFDRFPALQKAGIKRWVNGAITFTPDGNPLVGPVSGVPNYWAACGVMAGFSQCAAIGLALANWIVDGDPGADVFGMDVARFGAFAAEDGYLRALTSQFYARRFVMAYPNEELPAGRPLKTSPAFDDLADAGARFGAVWGLEVPLFFAPGDPAFEEEPSLRRSNAHDLVGEEVAAVRTAAGAYETAAYARYEVSGAGAEAWLDRILACRIPPPGRVRLAPVLRETGTLMGDLTVTRLSDDRFWLVGSYYLQEWHLRWFRDLLPPRGVELRNLSDAWVGFSVSGPSSRLIVQRAIDADLSAEAMPFLTARLMAFDGADAMVARLSLTGELGYEVTVPAAYHRSLLRALRSSGDGDGLRLVGDRAIDSLRLEKAYGIWSAEFTQAYTPGMSGLERFVAFDKGAFIGREAAQRERDRGPAQRLVLLEVAADGADASGDEPVWRDGTRVGFVTSGAFGHHVGRSLALAYVDSAVAEDSPALSVHIVGDERPARILPEPPYDPSGSRMRDI